MSNSPTSADPARITRSTSPTTPQCGPPSPEAMSSPPPRSDGAHCLGGRARSEAPPNDRTLRDRILTLHVSGVDLIVERAYPPTSLSALPGRPVPPTGWPCRFAACDSARNGLAWLVAVRLWFRLADSDSGCRALTHSRLVPGLAMVPRCVRAPRSRADRTL
jgi:hypothetical protein